MFDGFVRVSCAVPEVKVADCRFNAQNIIDLAVKANENNAGIVVFPELSITAYTCADLFLQKVLIENAENALFEIMDKTKDIDTVLVVGLPLRRGTSLYDCAAVIYRGNILGIVPKAYVKNYAEASELRWFQPFKETSTITIRKNEYPFGQALVFECASMPEFSFSVEIGNDMSAAVTPSAACALGGANIIVNLSASPDIVGRRAARASAVRDLSSRLCCAYVLSNAGQGESTQDLVYAGHGIVSENGKLLFESARFENGLFCTDVDAEKIVQERSRMNTFEDLADDCVHITFDMEKKDVELLRNIAPLPFIPENADERNIRSEEIIDLQAAGLVKRLKHIGCKNAVLGLSGGLDSTLAMIVTVRAFDMLGLDRSGILAISMPCFGTTGRTKNNSSMLAKAYGVAFREIPIGDTVRSHFRDIGHDENDHSVTYENAQARERTQVIMDVANSMNGVVIGTGDLSELALGWATYNGDHMSMYGVNAAIPKTLVRHLVSFEASRSDKALAGVLLDILDTPVSPELLPPVDGEISQKTEDLVGPYELHDFFLFNIVRYGFAPKKVYRMAKCAFKGAYDDATIKKWLCVFIRRFFAQQFKRSCLPDGPKIGTVGFSPRGDFRMPSDASRELWLQEAENL